MKAVGNVSRGTKNPGQTKNENECTTFFLQILDLICELFFQEDSDPQRYLRWADAFMVVYSITNRDSFQTVRKYLETIAQFIKAVGKDLPVAIVGNKIDLERYR